MTLTLGALVFKMIELGVGQEEEDVNGANQEEIRKIFYGTQMIWVLDTSLIRLSALAFYARVFNVRSNAHRTWKIIFYVVCGICVFWLLATFVLAAFFLCNPISAFWEDPAPHCTPLYNTNLSGSIGNFFVDLTILFLPLPQVLKLNIRSRKKLTISLSFMFGYG